MTGAPKIATRGAISPFIVMDVLRSANERAAAGQDVLHLEVGQPSAPAPRRVRAAAARALRGDRLGYTDALGHPPLRRAIAADYAGRCGIALDWQRVVVTTGSSGAFILAFLAAFDAGDRVALASPGYPAYRNILRALGVEVVGIPVDAGTNFQPPPTHLDAIASPLHGLIIASPANPTGTMLHRGGAVRARRRLCGTGDTAGLRRDLPRDHLRRRGGECPGPRQSERHRRQQLLEVLRDDRVAARLAGPAPRASSPGGVPGSESVHLAADAVAAGRR